MKTFRVYVESGLVPYEHYYATVEAKTEKEARSFMRGELQPWVDITRIEEVENASNTSES